MNAAHARIAKTVRLMIPSLGPRPIEVSEQDYMSWVYQQLPSFIAVCSFIAATFFYGEIHTNL